MESMMRYTYENGYHKFTEKPTREECKALDLKAGDSWDYVEKAYVGGYVHRYITDVEVFEGKEVFLVGTKNTGMRAIIAPDQCHTEVFLDVNNFFYHKECVIREKEKEEKRKRKEEAFNDLYGYEKTLTNLQRGIATKALNKDRLRDGKLVVLKELLKEMVEDGYRVEGESPDMRLASKDGSYLEQKKIGKHGMGLAKYLGELAGELRGESHE